MSRRLLVIIAVLAAANVSAFAVAEAAPGSGSLDPAGPGTIVAVVDSGVDATLPQLVGRVLPGLDLVGGAGAPDPSGHGTAVATALAARCQQCSILPVRVLSDRGAAPWARVAAGIVWAVDNGARVVNVSIAGPDGSAELRAAVAYAVASDVLVVAAAGNEGETRAAFPAAYPGVVAVGASDAHGELHSWSSRGSWVDLVAPGCAVLPVRGRIAWACGTSFAAPLVSATSALARGARPEATATEIAASLPAHVETRQKTPSISVRGPKRVGTLLRATVSEPGLGARLRWFRCGRGECVRVGAGSAYRVRAADAGSTLIALLVTEPFGQLPLAASQPVAVG